MKNNKTNPYLLQITSNNIKKCFIPFLFFTDVIYKLPNWLMSARGMPRMGMIVNLQIVPKAFIKL